MPAAASTAEATSQASAATAESTDEINATATAIANAQSFLPLAEVMNTFNIIAPLNLSAQSLPVTPTPTIAPSATIPSLTGDLSFGAVTDEPTGEATSEASAGTATIPATPIAATPAPAVTSEATAAATAAS